MKGVNFFRNVIREIEEGVLDIKFYYDTSSRTDIGQRRIFRWIIGTDERFCKKGPYKSLWTFYKGEVASNNVLGERMEKVREYFSYKKIYGDGFYGFVGEGKENKAYSHINVRLMCLAFRKSLHEMEFPEKMDSLNKKEREKLESTIIEKVGEIWESLATHYDYKDTRPEWIYYPEWNLSISDTDFVGFWCRKNVSVSFRLGRGVVLTLDKNGVMHNPFSRCSGNANEGIQVHINENVSKGVVLFSEGFVENNNGEECTQKDAYKLLIRILKKPLFYEDYVSQLSERLLQKATWCDQQEDERNSAMVVGYSEGTFSEDVEMQFQRWKDQIEETL